MESVRQQSLQGEIKAAKRDRMQNTECLGSLSSCQMHLVHVQFCCCLFVCVGVYLRRLRM